MSDNLRDRIAEVLRPIAAPDYGLTVHDLADAVLRELGLTPEFGCGTSDLRHGCRCSHRYVTEWETDASR